MSHLRHSEFTVTTTSKSDIQRVCSICSIPFCALYYIMKEIGEFVADSWNYTL